jgi:hypothetical protein
MLASERPLEEKWRCSARFRDDEAAVRDKEDAKERIVPARGPATSATW